MFFLLQIAIAALMVLYLSWRGAHHHRHSNRDWHAIAAGLRSGTSRFDRLQNARLMVELAHYAERHGNLNPGLRNVIVRDAMQARMSAIFGR